MRTRKEKIEFLRGIMTGARTVNELQPVKNYCFIQNDTNPDLYHCTNPEMNMTREQLDKFQLSNPNSLFFMIVGTKTPDLLEAILKL